MRWGADRRAAAAGVAVAAAVVLGTVAFARAPLTAAAGRDPGAAAELVRALAASEGTSWVVGYRFTRVRADGRTLRAAVVEARRDGVHLVRQGASLTVETRDQSYECTLVDDRAQCLVRPARAALAPSEVVRVAIATHGYDATRGAGVTIAGERARCFRVRSARAVLPGLGLATDFCFATDGVPLRTRVLRPAGRDERPAGRDERIALGVQRRPSRARIAALLRGFEAQTQASPR